MTASFPTSIKSYTTKVDGVDYPLAAHINSPQEEIVAIETALGVNMVNNLCCITHFTTLFNPADSTTYFVGNSGIISSTIGSYHVKFPKNGKVMFFVWNIFVTGTLGSNENVSLYINKTGTDVNTITTTEQLTAVKNEGLVDLTSTPISVTTSDYLSLKMVCPAWATNPTQIQMRCDIYWVPET